MIYGEHVYRNQSFFFYMQEEENIYLLRLFTEKQSQMFKDFWQQLESCICKLKNDVAAIVKKKRQEVAYSRC